MSVFGIDYAWSHPGIAAMKALNVQFVCRYLSNDPSKNLTRPEAQAISDADMWCVVVWETTAKRALSGRTGGETDAKEAAKQATACGMPIDRPIYFAVDWDATAGDQTLINAYLDGAASVLGRERVGLYAGYYTMTRAFNAGKIAFGWQTYAWSGGQWEARAHIQQYKNGVNVGGADCDYNRATPTDYGQWRIGESPMTISKADAKVIADAVVDAGINARGWTVGGVLQGTQESNARQERAITALAAAVAGISKPDVDETAIVAGVLAGLDPAKFADAVAEHLGAAQAGVVLDALRSRLES